jgi:hypothetical protein
MKIVELPKERRQAALGTAEKSFEQSGWKTCPMVTPVAAQWVNLNMQLLRLLVARMETRIVQLNGIILTPNRDDAAELGPHR